MAVLTFDIAAFRAAFPQFADVTDAQLEYYWDVACLISGLNTDGSPISNLTSRQTILFLLVCHLATLAQMGDVMTGQLTSATEGFNSRVREGRDETILGFFDAISVSTHASARDATVVRKDVFMIALFRYFARRLRFGAFHDAQGC